MLAKRFCVAISFAALAITGLEAKPASADLPAAAANASSCAMIIMAEGDIRMTWVEGFPNDLCSHPLHPWVLVGNVFSSAGTGAPGPVVGMNEMLEVLAANGDWFQLIAGSCDASATYEGNVFDLAGVRVPGEEFVTFGGRSPSGGREYAATNLGNVYRRDTCSGSSWSYVGNLAGATAGVQNEPLHGPRMITTPNPFQQRTMIHFTLDTPGQAELRILDVAGRVVRKLSAGRLASGPHQVEWDGTDESARSLSKGTYFYALVVDGRTVGSQKAVLQH